MSAPGRRETALRRGRLTLDLAMGLVMAGLAAVAIAAWIEYLTHPGLSFIAAYHRGREPWTAIGAWTILVGGTAALLIGVGIALIEGSWIRRLLAAAALAIGVVWWLTALGLLPSSDVTRLDPERFAIAQPGIAAAALLLPAALAALLVFTPRREVPRSRMAPVHSEEDR